ncbi:hypothetical protein Hanom_Chr06g00565571 [Helianthus anomalus]
MKNFHMENQSILNRSVEIPLYSSTHISIILYFLFRFVLPFSFIRFHITNPNFNQLHLWLSKGNKRFLYLL